MKKLIFIISVIVILGVILLFWFHYHINKEPEVKDQLLSKNDIDTINSYKAKYQSFIVPSDAEVLNVAKILLSSNLTTDKVEKLLAGC